MSKQSEAKVNQGYNPKPDQPMCSNCEYFVFDYVQTREPSSWNPNGFWEDKNLRCAIGGFAVKKMGTCNRHAFALKMDKEQ